MAGESSLGMSDEDFMKSGPPVVTEPTEQPETTDPVEPVEEETDPVEPAAEPGKVEPVEELTEPEEEEQKETEPVADPKAAKTEPKKEATEPKADKAKAEPAPEFDHKAFTDKVMAPFKANGREMQVKDADEAVQLMQMGANYNKKMAGLKPHLALLKQLENNDLLSDEKIGFLIDLHKKNPEAIGKLIKDSGIDPLELDEKAVSGYKPNSYAVAPQQIALDDVLDSLKESPKYEVLLDVVANKWNEASKQLIVETPQVLSVLDAHMHSGIFDLITTEVERQKALGKLPGVSDLLAYQQVGDAMNAQGAFNHLAPPPAAKAPPVQKVVTAPAKVVDEKLEARRRAAAPAKVAPATKTPPAFNPLALSDEEFAKLGLPSFT